MAADKRRRHGTAGRRKVWIAALAVFLVVDVALVGLALSQPGSDAETLSAASVPSPSETPTATSSATPLPDLEPLTRPSGYLSAVDSTTAYRLSAGDCTVDEPLTLEKTVDAGATWISNDVTTTLRSVTQFAATSDTYAYMVGLNNVCEPDFTATYTSGTGFGSYPDELTGVWYLDTTDGALHSPSGIITAPCSDVVDIDAIDDLTAAVMCSDRTFARTSDGGVTWGSPLTLAGAVSTSTGVGNYVIAQTGREGCAGVRVSTLGGSDNAPSVIGCYETSDESLRDGDVAVSGTQNSIWLQVQGRVVVSTDGGVTWA